MIRDKKINYFENVFSTTRRRPRHVYTYVHLTGPIIIITYFVIAFKNFMPCITNVGNFRPGWRDPFLSSHQLPHWLQNAEWNKTGSIILRLGLYEKKFLSFESA